jgi:Domain of unknown function (DUF4124)
MKMTLGVFVLALALGATGAWANEVYKSTMPNGSVVYGESPQAGAQKVEKIEARAAPTGTIVVTDQDRHRAGRISSPAGTAGVVTPQKREPAPPLEAGTLSKPGAMPKRDY